MKSQLHKHWHVVVVVCLALGLAIAATAVSVGHATGSGGTDQSVSNPEKAKPTKADDGNKMSAVQSTAGTVKVTESSFDDQVLKSDVPVLVDFYAEWCGPCHVQAPILDELAREIETAKIVKVDVDENQQLATRYEIRSIPTLLVFKNGQVIARHQGVASKEQLKTLLAR